MRWRFAPMILLVLGTTVLLMVALKGGDGMALPHKNTEVDLGLPHSDTHSSGTFETATFALG